MPGETLCSSGAFPLRMIAARRDRRESTGVQLLVQLQKDGRGTGTLVLIKLGRGCADQSGIPVMRDTRRCDEWERERSGTPIEVRGAFARTFTSAVKKDAGETPAPLFIFQHLCGAFARKMKSPTLAKGR